MKKAQREIYLELANEVEFTLCSFCKYTECVAGDSPCDCGDSYCIHPLKVYCSFPDVAEPGDDCWAFRPIYDVTLCVDTVGILLEKGWQEAVWWKNKKGDLRIAGV